MHGREGEERRRSWHMWPVPAHAKLAASPPPITVAAVDPSNCCSNDFFIKDGRRICVGDCALFQSGNSPAFIGIIRWFSSSKEDHHKLGVNWLYRPADIKLAKGILLEAAPNEVFYSFHKDEISADSLLHPCKVAFLRKGVELPSGVSSFVCRRVYDIANKCLWWLTDQDYINERQDEVDQLLDKTRLEMHAAVQPGGRSPKPLNGPTSVPQLKPGSDNVQNSGTSITFQGKGKRREKVELGSDAIKRDHVPKADNGDSGHFILDSKVKAEVAKVTDKGGLINNEGVEKLVNLMQLDKLEKKIDLPGRILLADVIASTDRIDCLGRFVQLKGVLVLDDWLQEARKGKAGDNSGPKENDKSVEELLLVLLRALDKLPVNLHALQTSNIGKSVNHLRSHKNTDIQKKARSLVDTWKKRVDAEMSKISDAKSVAPSQAISWSGKSGFSEVCHAAPNKSTGSSELVMKASASQSSTSKNLPGKSGHGDPIVKSPPASLGSSKLPGSSPSSMVICSKDVQCNPVGTSGSVELQLTTTKDEKSSGSSQSQNNSQSCSTGHAKATGNTWKEDARSSHAGSMKVSKTSGVVNRHRKSNGGLLGIGASGVQKEANLGKCSSVNRNMSSHKVSQSGLTSERSLDLPVSDHGNSHRLIVRLPNPGQSPARSTSGASVEEPSTVGGRALSPGASEKREENDHKIKVKEDACEANIAGGVIQESWQSGNIKGPSGSIEGDRLPSASSEEHKNNDENGKAEEAMKASCSSSASEKSLMMTDPKMGKSYDPSFCSINALVESCAQYTESASSLSTGDDVGMNLLASVATEEMCKSDLVSPPSSPLRSSPAREDPYNSNESKQISPGLDIILQGPNQHGDRTNSESEKHAVTIVSSDSKSRVILQQPNSPGEHKELCIKLGAKPVEETTDGGDPVSSSPAHMKEDDPGVGGANYALGKQKPVGKSSDSLVESKKARSPSLEEHKPAYHALEKIADDSRSTSGFICSSMDGGTESIHASSRAHADGVDKAPKSCPSDMDIEKPSIVNEWPNATMAAEEKLQCTTGPNPDAVNCSIDALVSAGFHIISSDCVDELKTESTDDVGIRNQSEPGDSGKKEHGITPPLDDQIQLTVVPSCTTHGIEEKKVLEHQLTTSASHEEPARSPTHEFEQCAKPVGSKLPGPEADEVEGLSSSTDASLSNFPGMGNPKKCGFDLNEGILGDDTNQEEPAKSASPGYSSVPLPALPPFAVSPISSGSPIAITVAAPAKGPFVPPENLFIFKGEPGWKGSAATSAFRPAEPRKVLEMPLSTSEVSSDAAGKQSRPTLDIDLNVPDERILEDVSGSTTRDIICQSGCITVRDTSDQNATGLDLDLNKVDEITDNGQFSGSTGRRAEASLLPGRPASGGFPNDGAANVPRDFDLNNGPGVDEASVEPIPRNQHSKSSSLPFLAPVSSLGNTDLGNLSSWFLPGNAYSAVAIPSFLPDRGDQPYPIVAAAGPQRLQGCTAGGGSIGTDIYRGPVLSSSPAMAFSPAAAFPYAGFPFGSSFPLASTSFTGGSTTYTDSSSGVGQCFPAIPSHIFGSANATTPSAFVRPSLINLQECSTSGVASEGSRKWGRQNLDLNAGPGSGDAESREDRLASATRQSSVASPQAFAEEQARMYQVGNVGLKRKEPEGGWESERFTYKQPSWQ